MSFDLDGTTDPGDGTIDWLLGAEAGFIPIQQDAWLPEWNSSPANSHVPLSLNEYLGALTQQSSALIHLDDDVLQLHKKEIRSEGGRRNLDAARRRWLGKRLQLPDSLSASSLMYTSNAREIVLLARLPVHDQTQGHENDIQVLEVEFDHIDDGQVAEYYFKLSIARFHHTTRSTMQTANGRISIQSEPLQSTRCRIYYVDPRAGKRYCSSRFAVFGTRQLHGLPSRKRVSGTSNGIGDENSPIHGFETPNDFDRCDTEVLEDNVNRGKPFCWNSKRRDIILQLHPDLARRLPIERQFCPPCFARQAVVWTTPPYELLGHERAWQLEWGVKMARAFAQMHLAEGIAEPRFPVGAGITRDHEFDIEIRRAQAEDRVRTGLAAPLTSTLLGPLFSQLPLREDKQREELAHVPSSVHCNSLWNVEPSDSVVIRNGDEIYLLNARFDGCRKIAPLDPLHNLARYVFLARILSRQRDGFRERIEGRWLLETYFDNLGWGSEARRSATRRFWLWLDMEFMLYLYYYIAAASNAFTAEQILRILQAICDLEEITETNYSIRYLGEVSRCQLMSVPPIIDALSVYGVVL